MLFSASPALLFSFVTTSSLFGFLISSTFAFPASLSATPCLPVCNCTNYMDFSRKKEPDKKFHCIGISANVTNTVQ